MPSRVLGTGTSWCEQDVPRGARSYTRPVGHSEEPTWSTNPPMKSDQAGGAGRQTGLTPPARFLILLTCTRSHAWRSSALSCSQRCPTQRLGSAEEGASQPGQFRAVVSSSHPPAIRFPVTHLELITLCRCAGGTPSESRAFRTVAPPERFVMPERVSGPPAVEPRRGSSLPHRSLPRPRPIDGSVQLQTPRAMPSGHGVYRVRSEFRAS